MLLDHDRVDRLGVPESQETKATRATSGTVMHHRTFLDFTELREVVTKRFCIRMPVRLELAVTDDKYDGVSSSLNQVCPVYEYVRSVVSQFNPPMNIFLTKPILAFLPEAHKVSNNNQSRRSRAQVHEREPQGKMCVLTAWSMWMRLSALAKELGGAKLLFTSTASAELSEDVLRELEEAWKPKSRSRAGSLDAIVLPTALPSQECGNWESS